MNLEFDEAQWPDLTTFRKACLADDIETVKEIADREHPWYVVENPDNLELPKLAKIFQAQYHSACGNLKEIQSLVELEPWVVNSTWTSQLWTPLCQAAVSEKNKPVIEYLIKKNANLSAIVGGPGQEGTIPDMARYYKLEDLAEWLENEIKRIGEGKQGA